MVAVEQILAALPYDEPFRFVDSISRIDENGVEGQYAFRPDADFYRGHFKGHPVTPGVLLVETMAQIGLVCLGIFLTEGSTASAVALTSAEVEFLLPILPGETVRVVSTKKYFRFNKLKCAVELYTQRGELACSGTIAGMITSHG